MVSDDWPKVSNKELVSYIAGIIDGEGYIGMVRSTKKHRKNPNPQYSLAMTVGMTDDRPLRLIQAMFGGNIRQMKQDDSRGKAVWSWNADSRSVCFDVAQALRGQLIVKREQVELAYLYLTSIQTGDRDPSLREAFYLKFRILNKTGVDK